ncbi:MAG: aminotransferase class V-fold PLP-dependent enzyme, partial [Bacteriovoracaceae bacterium]|nr:aminotransferase class V-fold PLP-dependent enzyme [Bacteriovoracaceae bacterium]
TMVQDFYATSPLAAGGIKVRPLPLERGRLDEAMFFASLGPQTKLILLSSVNNTCGLINPVERWSWEIKRHAPQALIHLDHGQGFLKHPLQAHCFDSITVPSTKIGGPGGIAGLWLRQKTIWHPWLYGGGHEYNLRASSLTYPLIKSFAAAVREQVPQVAARAKTAAHLKQVFQQTLRQEVEGIRFWVEEDDEGQENGQGLAAFSPYMTLAYFPKVSSDILLRYLEREDIMAAASSACSSHIAGYDPVLAALGLLESDHKKVLRFSWAATTLESDLVMAAHRVAYHYRSLAKFAGR